MKSNNRKQTVELGSGPQNTSVRSAAEPREKVEDANPAADAEEQPETAETQSAETPSPHSPQRDEHGTFPTATMIPRESDGEEDEDDEDEDDEDEDEDDELDKLKKEFVFYPKGVSSDHYSCVADRQKKLVPTTVRDNDPEVLALLRSLDEGSQAGHALAGYLEKHNDPRADAVKVLTTAQPSFPASSRLLDHEITILATDSWHVTAQCGDSDRGCHPNPRDWWREIVLKASPYPGTKLSKVLLNYGDIEFNGPVQMTCEVYRGQWNARTVRSAFEWLRQHLICGLFHATPLEVNCPPEYLTPLRVKRFLRMLRQPQSEAADYVCKMIQDAPRLQEALMAALAKRKADRLIWHGLMDHLNPGWQSRVVFKSATSPPETRPA